MTAGPQNSSAIIFGRYRRPSQVPRAGQEQPAATRSVSSATSRHASGSPYRLGRRSTTSWCG
jgi:hypothetical protein